MNCLRRFNGDIMIGLLYISALDQARKLKFNSSSATFEQNILIWSRLTETLQCGSGLYFQYFNISVLEKCYKVKIKHLCSPSIYKHNLKILSRLVDLAKCM